MTFLSPSTLGLGCGVGDHGYFLASALAERCRLELVTALSGPRDLPPGIAPKEHMVVPSPWSRRRSIREIVRRVREFEPHWILLEYAPHLLSPRGVNRWAGPLVRALARGPGEVLLFFHEIAQPWQLHPIQGPKGIYQSLLARFLVRHARGAIVSSFERVDQIRRSAPPGFPVEKVAIGSNIPVVPCSAEDRQALRATRQIGPDSLVLGVFGLGHYSVQVDQVLAAQEALRSKSIESDVVVLGPLGDRFPEKPRVHRLGFLPVDQVSRWLGACDLYLAPLVDGISTRRGTVAAALAHGLPIVATLGPNTDREMFGSETVRLVPVDSEDAFTEAVVDLASHPESRIQLGQAGQALYASQYAWEAVAAQILRFATESSNRPLVSGMMTGTKPRADCGID